MSLQSRSLVKLCVISIGAFWLGGLTACGDDDPPAGAGPGGQPDGGTSDSGGVDSGSCAPACKATETCCGSRCVDFSADIDNCGQCGRRCSAQHAAVTCTAGECAIGVCEQGFLDCNQNSADGCEATDQGLPGTPRPLSPANGEYTGSVHAQASAMPALRWVEPQTPGSCGALSYEIDLDDSCELGASDACAFPSPEARGRGVTETSWKPAQALAVKTTVPVGTVYFWRVRACEPGNRCSDWSPVRYLNVGRLRDDLTGDGFSDVVALIHAGTATDPRAYVVPGGRDGFGAVQPVRLVSPIEYFPEARFLGDVNGDGFMDAMRVDSAGATLLLGAQDIAAVSSMPLPVPASAGRIHHAGAALGDYDADGFADFAVSHYSPLGTTAEPASVTRIYRGSATLSSLTPLEVLPPAGTTPLEFGLDLEGALDLNGDGYTDLAILDGDDGRLHMVYGGAAGSTQIRASLQTGGACVRYVAPERVPLRALGRAGDVNGDGFGDLAARCDRNALVFLGGRTPSLTAAWTHAIPGAYGRSLVGGHDLGGDGLADVIFHGEGTGVNLILLGGDSALSSTAAPIDFGGRLPAPNIGPGLTVGDHDGDGRPDVLLHDYSGMLRWFSGGRTESSTEVCTQPTSSFGRVGNWCEAVRRDIEAVYATAGNPKTPIGTSFGFVLAR